MEYKKLFGIVYVNLSYWCSHWTWALALGDTSKHLEALVWRTLPIPRNTLVLRYKWGWVSKAFYCCWRSAFLQPRYFLLLETAFQPDFCKLFQHVRGKVPFHVSVSCIHDFIYNLSEYMQFLSFNMGKCSDIKSMLQSWY